MAFFDDLGKKITQAGGTVAQKTKDVAGVAKLNVQISDLEHKQNDLYTQLGKVYFKKA